MLSLLERITIDNYPDVIAIICIPLIMSILTIAFPLLTNSRDKVREQYKSRSNAAQFDKERSNIWFRKLLVISLMSVLIWLLQFPAPYIENEYCSYIIDNSSVILLLVSTFFLVLYLLKFIFLLKKYHNPDELIHMLESNFSKKDMWFKILIKRFSPKLLIKLEKTTKHHSKLYNQKLVPISELFYYSIREEDEVLSRYIISFFDNNIKYLKSAKTNESVIYISEFYDLVYNSTIEIAKQKKKLSSIFNTPIMLGYLVDDLREGGISDKSYSYIWHSLLQLIFYDNQTIIQSYWSTAHQVLAFHLNDLGYNNFSSDNSIDNSPSVERFKEFHYLLGALLLYSEKYELLSKCIRFTHSQPAKYVLVPSSLQDLVNEYARFQDNISSPIYYEKYTFTDLKGVDSGDYIIMWLNRYFALLFIRQYQMKYEYTVSFGYNNLPSLYGKNPKELVQLRDKMRILKMNVEYYLDDSNREILKKLGLDNLDKLYSLNEDTSPNPIQDLYIYIRDIEKEMNHAKITQTLSKSKIDEFKEETEKIINESLKDISKALNDHVIEQNEIAYPQYIGNSKRDILSKGGFADNQDISYLNSTSITAKRLASEMNYYFSVSFGRAVKRSYSVYVETIFDALDKLELDNDNLIVDIGLNVKSVSEFYSKRSRIIEDSGNIYFLTNNGVRIDIVTLPSVSIESLNNSLIVLKKTDLPYLEKHDVDGYLIREYKLELIDEVNKVYGSIIDLNKDIELREEVGKGYIGNDVLSESVLSTVSVSYELRWKKNAYATQIQVFSPYDTKGDITKIDDIKPVN